MSKKYETRIQRVGYFNEELKIAEDLELDLRIINNGYKLVYTPTAKVRHHGRQSMSKFILQMYNYGVWRAWAGKQYPGLLKPKHLLPSLFLVLLIFSALFTTVTSLSTPISLLVSVILLSYLSAGLITGLKISQKSKTPSHVVAIPLLGFIEHVSYGLGILYGLLSKQNSGE